MILNYYFVGSGKRLFGSPVRRPSKSIATTFDCAAAERVQRLKRILENEKKSRRKKQSSSLIIFQSSANKLTQTANRVPSSNEPKAHSRNRHTAFLWAPAVTVSVLIIGLSEKIVTAAGQASGVEPSASAVSCCRALSALTAERHESISECNLLVRNGHRTVLLRS